jgi:hypothetical protein
VRHGSHRGGSALVPPRPEQPGSGLEPAAAGAEAARRPLVEADDAPAARLRAAARFDRPLRLVRERHSAADYLEAVRYAGAAAARRHRRAAASESAQYQRAEPPKPEALASHRRVAGAVARSESAEWEWLPLARLMPEVALRPQVAGVAAFESTERLPAAAPEQVSAVTAAA